RHEPVELHEAALVQEQVDPLPGRELAPRVLRRDALRSAAQLGLTTQRLEPGQLLPHAHGAPPDPGPRVVPGAPPTGSSSPPTIRTRDGRRTIPPSRTEMTPVAPRRVCT